LTTSRHAQFVVGHVVALPEGGYRIWYEAPLPDESHELRTERIPR
jgi:hypothetical protein